MSTIIKVEGISKQYRLGLVGTGTLAHDINRWWHQVRGKPDPYLAIGDENDRAAKGSSEYVWALRDVDFQVNKGEVLGIIGRNGAGKSTLLKILSRTTTPTGGNIKIKGKVASLLEVGTGFHPELSGRENIYLNGAILGMNKQEIRDKFDEIVDFAGVERYIDTPVKRYSSGMYVRLAFGVAAHLDPDILIVDEVLAVGDAEFQKKAIGKMQSVSQTQGRTVLVVSHNMSTIQKLCSRAIVFEKGRIRFDGAPRDAVAFYDKTSEMAGEFIEKHEYDLTNHPGKVFHGGMEKVEIFCNGQPTNLMYPGCNFSFHTSVATNKSISDIHFGFVINREDGTPVIGINNDIYGQKLSVLPVREGKIKVDIPSLPLLQSGVYTVDLFLAEGYQADFDIIKNAFSLKIDASLTSSFILPINESINQIYVDKVSFSLENQSGN